jgi:hypothetical protein
MERKRKLPVVTGRTVWSVLKRRPARRQREVSEMGEVGEEPETKNKNADSALTADSTQADLPFG